MRGNKIKQITRNHYINKLIDEKNTPNIKVITVVRISGKSKLMDAFIDILEKESLLIMIEDFLMDNIGSKTSIRNVANKLTSNSYKTNDKTVGAYIEYLCKSFLFYPIKRYDIKGKKYLELDKKYYLANLSFRYAQLGTKNADYGYLYKNIVDIELLRRGYEVYIGALYDKEVDFVAIK